MKRQEDSHSTPPISKLVIEWLARTFPDRVPGIDMSNREIWIAVGRQDVIRKLDAEYRRQSNPSESDD